MPITKPADGSTGWGGAVRATIGAVNAARTVYSTDPPPGLTAIAADGITNDTATVQAHLNHIGGLGGGTVSVSAPDRTIKFGSGITVPVGVRLVSDRGTSLDFTGIGQGTAITVSDDECSPLEGLFLVGPNGNNPAANPADASTGIKIHGSKLYFRDIWIRGFGRGVDVVSDNTYLLSFMGGDIGWCGTCIYAPLAGAANNSGENLRFDHFTLYNSRRILHATGNQLGVYLSNTSLDYSAEFGVIADAWVFLTGCHLETSAAGGGTGSYLFDVDNNSKVFLVNCGIIANGVRYLFRADKAPFNFGNGQASISTSWMFFSASNGSTPTHKSDHIVEFPANATTLTFDTPWPIRWSPVTASFAALDFRPQPNTDQIAVSVDQNNGTVTLTAPAYAGARWARIQF